MNISVNAGSLSAPVIGGAALLAFVLVLLIALGARKRRSRKAGASGDTNNLSRSAEKSARKAEKSARKAEKSARKAGKDSNKSADTAKSAEAQPAPKPEYAALAFLVQPEPLGNIPGTGLPADLIALAGRSISHHVAALGEASMESDESAALLHVALWKAIESKFAAELCTENDPEPTNEIQHLVLNAIELSSSAEGYAARISYHNKKYTVLIGSAAPVALASAPFSTELAEFVDGNRHNDSTLVLVIDGIAYAAISLNEIALKA